MTQQLLRRREVDGRAVERVKARYEADGFEVSFGKRLRHHHQQAPETWWRLTREHE